MSPKQTFPSLGEWGETRATLHAYSRVITSVPRRWAEPNPHWWHLTLEVSASGLVTTPVKLPDGTNLRFRMDLANGVVHMEVDDRSVREWPLSSGMTADELAEEVFREAASLGLKRDYDPAKYRNGDTRRYDPEQGAQYFLLLSQLDRVFDLHKWRLPPGASPNHLWPHGFDFTMEWFGSRQIPYGEGAAKKHLPAQINLGWAPGDSSFESPYFFSSPWPFDHNTLPTASLVEGARWVTIGWEGAMIPYSLFEGDPQAEDRLLQFAWRVFDLARPALTIA